jgi:hypothetical protein
MLTMIKLMNDTDIVAYIRLVMKFLNILDTVFLHVFILLFFIYYHIIIKMQTLSTWRLLS